jgi:hypothetical protein
MMKDKFITSTDVNAARSHTPASACPTATEDKTQLEEITLDPVGKPLTRGSIRLS